MKEIYYIKYTVDGQEYEGSIDSGDNMKIGSTVTVDYNPDDPTDVSVSLLSINVSKGTVLFDM